MLTYKICCNCINSKRYDEQDFSLLCKKTGTAVNASDSCNEFAPKNMNNQNRLERIRIELFDIANSYASSGSGYIALALRGISQTLHGILECLKEKG